MDSPAIRGLAISKSLLVSLANIVGKPRVRITIIENVAVWTNIARTNILAATMRKDPRSI
jgi:hypothetical protein